LADLWPAGLLEETLTAEGLVRLAWEWPLRWWKPLHDRGYATHISSADLLQLTLRPLRQLGLLPAFWQQMVPRCFGVNLGV
jgi:hypothetical protein